MVLWDCGILLSARNVYAFEVAWHYLVACWNSINELPKLCKHCSDISACAACDLSALKLNFCTFKATLCNFELWKELILLCFSTQQIQQQSPSVSPHPYPSTSLHAYRVPKSFRLRFAQSAEFLRSQCEAASFATLKSRGPQHWCKSNRMFLRLHSRVFFSSV